MAYGHAERNLTLVRLLEAETTNLLRTLEQLDPEQSAWLQDHHRSRPLRAQSAPAAAADRMMLAAESPGVPS